jgi:universal stress protein A
MFISRILVPVDFSGRSQAALQYAVDLARACEARVTVLHVVPAPSLAAVAADVYLDRPVALVAPEVMNAARAQIDELISDCFAGVPVEGLIEIGAPAQIIARKAAEGSFDLIVIGTRARVGLAELVLGSVAHELMASAPCPIVTLREQRAAA